MEVMPRTDGTRISGSSAGRTCAVGNNMAAGRKSTPKPRSHSDMETDVAERYRKSDFPACGRQTAVSRFGISSARKSSLKNPVSLSSNAICQQLHHQQQQQQQQYIKSRYNGSAVNMPLPPPPPLQSSMSPPPQQLQSSMSPPPVRSSQSSPSVSLLSRAAQKIGLTPKKKPPNSQNQQQQQQQLQQLHRPQPQFIVGSSPATFRTNFARIVAQSPPPVPHGFLRPNNTFGKVKVILRIIPLETTNQSCLSVDPFRRHVTAVDLLSSGSGSGSGGVSALQRPPQAPKTFLYDAVITQAEPLSTLCCHSLTEVIHAVVGGLDGCVLSYGHARLGKTFSMIGSEETTSSLGLLPTAISWLYQLIGDRRKQTGQKYLVRLSALEVAGKEEELRDLLAGLAGDGGARVTMRDDPISGLQLENLSELGAPTAEQAAYYLDAAIASKNVSETKEIQRNSHFIVTLHVYQLKVNSSRDDLSYVEGASVCSHSKLYFYDFGSFSKAGEGTALSFSALGLLVLALLNGQRHVPYRDSKLAQLVKSSIGGSGCHSTIVVHASSSPHHYTETLQILQLSSRMNRLRVRKRSKAVSNTGSDESFNSQSYKHRKGVRMGTLRKASHLYTSGCEGGFYSSASSEVSTEAASLVDFGSAGYKSDSRCSYGPRSGPPSASGSCVTLDPVIESCYETLQHHQQRLGNASEHKTRRYDHQRRHQYYHDRSAPSSTVSAPAYNQERRILGERTNDDETRFQKPRRTHRSSKESAMFQPTKELWIDGPKADYSGQSKAASTSSGNVGYNNHVRPKNGATAKNYVMPRERFEQWVDGPPEFQTGALASASQAVHKISYSKIVKVASLSESHSAEALLDFEGSQRSHYHDDHLALGNNIHCFGELPVDQSTPKGTLKRGEAKSSRSEREVASSSSSSALFERNLEHSRQQALKVFCKAESQDCTIVHTSSVDLSRFTVSNSTNVERPPDARESGDGKEIIDAVTGEQQLVNNIANIGDYYNSANAFTLDRQNEEVTLKRKKQRTHLAKSANNGETAFDTTTDRAEGGDEIEDIASMLLTNRESIYEIQMDKDLELSSGSDSLRKLTCSSDDDSTMLWNDCSQSSIKSNTPGLRSPERCQKSNTGKKEGDDDDDDDRQLMLPQCSLKKNDGRRLESSTTDGFEQASEWMERDFNVETFYVPVELKNLKENQAGTFSHGFVKTQQRLVNGSRAAPVHLYDENLPLVSRSSARDDRMLHPKNYRIPCNSETTASGERHSSFNNRPIDAKEVPSSSMDDTFEAEMSTSVCNKPQTKSELSNKTTNAEKRNSAFPAETKSNICVPSPSHHAVIIESPPPSQIKTITGTEQLDSCNKINISNDFDITPDSACRNASQPDHHHLLLSSEVVAKQARISKVPKLSSFSNNSSPKKSSNSTASVASSKLSSKPSKAVSSPTSCSSAPLSGCSSPSPTNCAPPLTKDTESDAKAKVSARSGHSFLQKLRTPLFFRCKSQLPKNSDNEQPVKPVKTGKLVSKVSIPPKEMKPVAPSRLIFSKNCKNDPQIVSPTTTKLKHPVSKIPTSTNNSTANENKLLPATQSLNLSPNETIPSPSKSLESNSEHHDLDDVQSDSITFLSGSRSASLNIGSDPVVDISNDFHHNETLSLGSSVTSSMPSPVIDQSCHDVVMQLMSPYERSQQLPHDRLPHDLLQQHQQKHSPGQHYGSEVASDFNATKECSKNSEITIAVDVDSLYSGSVFAEIPLDPTDPNKTKSIYKARSRSEPDYRALSPANHVVAARDAKSADLCRKNSKNSADLCEKNLKKERSQTTDSNDDHKKTSASFRHVIKNGGALRDTLESKSKTSAITCFDVTCLAKPKS